MHTNSQPVISYDGPKSAKFYVFYLDLPCLFHLDPCLFRLCMPVSSRSMHLFGFVMPFSSRCMHLFGFVMPFSSRCMILFGFVMPVSSRSMNLCRFVMPVSSRSMPLSQTEPNQAKPSRARAQAKPCRFMDKKRIGRLKQRYGAVCHFLF